MRMRRGSAMVAVATVGLTAGSAPPAHADLVGGLLGGVTGVVGGVVGMFVGVVSTALDTIIGLFIGVDWGYVAF
jgi:hypothetical protein